MAAIVQPLGEPTFEDTHREIRRELEHGLDAMGKEQPGLAETCYAAALERASALDPDSRLTANCLGYLAKACAAQRKHKMAATMHERQTEQYAPPAVLTAVQIGKKRGGHVVSQ